MNADSNWRYMLDEAATLAHLLPDWVPSPTRIDYDGEEYVPTVDFEWCIDSRNIIVIFMVRCRVSWAGMYEGASSHGIDSVCNRLPEECLTLLRKVVDKMNSV